VQSFVFLGLLVFELEPMYATSDRRTDDKRRWPLNAPTHPLRGGGIITDLYSAFRSEDTEALLIVPTEWISSTLNSLLQLLKTDVMSTVDDGSAEDDNRATKRHRVWKRDNGTASDEGARRMQLLSFYSAKCFFCNPITVTTIKRRGKL